uniref:hypothetical protein n=1 Tax=Algoriphagus sp. TaxID=1872435 RepID=UPI0040489EF3
MNQIITKIKELKFGIFKNKSQIKIDDKLSFTPLINDYLDSYLTKFNNYLEYGSGSSTLYLSQKNIFKIISVESDFNFANSVISDLKSKNLKNTIVIKANIGLTGYWGYPLFNKSSPQKGLNYVSTPWNFLGEDYMPDVVLIDGRYRVACALNILIKAANHHKVSIIFDDYIGRDQYFIFQQFCDIYTTVDRMAFFEYNKSYIPENVINEMKILLEQYLKIAE